jgi:hypothetical protein
LAPALWLAAGSSIRATGNLEVASAAGKIDNRVWNNVSLPIVWRYHDPNTQAGCYSSVTAPPNTLLAAITAGFTSWQSNPDSRIAFSYGGTTTVRNVGADGVNVITFCDATVLSANQGYLARTPTTALTATMTVTAGGGCPAGQGILDANGGPPPAGFCFPVGTYPPGTIIDGDIEFNTFSTLEQDFGTDNTTPGKYDVQAVATHEEGHLHGLSHDPILQAVMFPFIDDVPASDGLGQRVLKPSDLSTSSHYYPESTFSTSYGSITGFISLDGVDADGVHVVAIDPSTMLAYKGVFSISRFEDTAAMGSEGPDFTANGPGFYRIDGLPAGNYYVYVEYFTDTEFLSARLQNRYNLTVGNSNVSNGNPGSAGQVGAWLGFIPRLAEFYNSGDSGHGGDGVNPGTALDNSDTATLVSVVAGAETSGVNIAINIEPVNGQTAGNRENPTTRTTLFNDAPLAGDQLTAFTMNGGTDDFYAIRYLAASLPAPPYNIAEGLWAHGGRNTQLMVSRIAFEDPNVPGRPALNDPIVASAGRVLTGGIGGQVGSGDFIDVRDQWNVTVNTSRDVWVIINQPAFPPGATLLTEGFFAISSIVVDPNGNLLPPRVGRTLTTQNGGSSYTTLQGDVIYDLTLEADPPVSITSASPASLTEGSTGDVNVNGTGFKSGAACDFGPGVTTNSVTFIGATQLRCNVTVSYTGATSSRGVNVKVTNPDVVFPNVSRVFTVTPAADSDGDGVIDSLDCSPANNTLKHAATEVQNLLVADLGGSAQLSWDSQDALNGTATTYDVATGLMADLAASQTYAMASCAVNNHPDTPFSDSTAVAVGDIRYWLVRASNACNVGSGTYGDSTLVPDPRDALDATGPCP